MKTVIILGAGASRSAGAPLMSDFLDIAYEYWKLGKLTGSDTDSFSRVFKGISALQSVHSKAQMEITNVENVFSAFEMGVSLRSFPSHTIEEINKLPNAIKDLIVSTLRYTIKFPVNSERVNAPKDYNEFAKMVATIIKDENSAPPISILTFNYDIALDYALYYHSIQYDYHVSQHKSNKLAFLKMHGSVNWSTCPTCREVIPVTIEDYLSKFTYRDLYGKEAVSIDIASKLAEFQHCSNALELTPVLVPPTWNKQDYHRSIINVWVKAAETLKNAENIFIIGYSLPPSDSFFKYLFALGTVGEFPLKRLWIFNPDKTGETDKRYRELLGPGAITRFQYFPLVFEGAINEISNALKKRK